jgi:hypothetical protein
MRTLRKAGKKQDRRFRGMNVEKIVQNTMDSKKDECISDE